MWTNRSTSRKCLAVNKLCIRSIAPQHSQLTICNPYAVHQYNIQIAYNLSMSDKSQWARSNINISSCSIFVFIQLWTIDTIRAPNSVMKIFILSNKQFFDSSLLLFVNIYILCYYIIVDIFVCMFFFFFENIFLVNVSWTQKNQIRINRLHIRMTVNDFTARFQRITSTFNKYQSYKAKRDNKKKHAKCIHALNSFACDLI